MCRWQSPARDGTQSLGTSLVPQNTSGFSTEPAGDPRSEHPASGRKRLGVQQQCPALRCSLSCGVHRDVCNWSWSREDRGARGTGVLVVLGQRQATSKPRFVCAAACFGSLSLPSASGASRASASLSPDLLRAVLSNLGAEGKRAVRIRGVLPEPLCLPAGGDKAPSSLAALCREVSALPCWLLGLVLACGATAGELSLLLHLSLVSAGPNWGFWGAKQWENLPCCCPKGSPRACETPGAEGLTPGPGLEVLCHPVVRSVPAVSNAPHWHRVGAWSP